MPDAKPFFLAPALALALLVGLGAPPAEANGRYPTARFMTFGPGATSTAIGLQTTFGYVFSGDAGKTWQLRCEEAIGFDPTETWDPPLVLTGNGGAVAGLPLGLSVAGASYCGFDQATSVPDEPILDLASDASGQKIVAATGPLSDPNGVWLSDDGGGTWRRGWSLANFLVLTVEVAPSNPQRMYASGLINSNTGALFMSDDGGATFTEKTRAFGRGAFVYISAVDPRNPDVVYVRVDLEMGTALSRSDDGGATFRELKRSGNRMTGFAISGDGKDLWVGSPGDLPDNGIHHSSDSGATWQPMSGGHVVLCLRHHDGILYMCTSPEDTEGVALACSSNAGSTFNPVLTWADLAGPETCPAGSPGRDLCAPTWDALRSRLIPDGGTPPAGPRGCPRTPTPDAAAPDTAPPDAPAPAPTAAADARPADARPDAGPVEAAPPAPPSSDGCACALSSPIRPRGSVPIAVLLAATTLISRRRRARARDSCTCTNPHG